jgi:glutamate dehydrogenase/leucine dehydrogenase
MILLKLSRIMSYKSALAGLDYGGAKAVIVKPKSAHSMRALLTSYSEQLRYLQDRFVTGADVGVGRRELELMGSRNEMVVGLHSDPVKYTGLSVCFAVTVTLEYLYGNPSLEGRTFAIQGLGKTGQALLKSVYKDAARVYVSDVDENAVASTVEKYPNITVVAPDAIYDIPVDVFAPCALSNSLTKETTLRLRSKAVVGSANGQLENIDVGTLLLDKGIVYAPDYVVNSGGLLVVADEYVHKEVNEDRVLAKLDTMKEILLAIYSQSSAEHKPTNQIADMLAQTKIAQFK